VLGIGRNLGLQPSPVGVQFGMAVGQGAQFLEHGGDLLRHPGLFGLGVVSISAGSCNSSFCAGKGMISGHSAGRETSSSSIWPWAAAQSGASGTNPGRRTDRPVAFRHEMTRGAVVAAVPPNRLTE
jgi:hypothetical protein